MLLRAPARLRLRLRLRHRPRPRAVAAPGRGYTNSASSSLFLGALRDFAGPDPQVKRLEESLQDVKREKETLLNKVEQLEEELRMKDEAIRKHEASVSDPILGTMIADLGQKKLFLASVNSLMDLPMWEKQRAYRDERAKSIAKDKEKSVVKETFPGVLTAYRFKQTGNLGLIDGQHRLGAYKYMCQNGIKEASTESIIVEVFELNDGKQADRLFTEINKAEPVKSIDLPGEAKPNIKFAIDGAVNQLHAKFGEMFKVSPRCKMPHVHMDTLREEIFESEVCDNLGLNTEEKLMNWLMQKNEALSKETDEQWALKREKRGSEKTYLKALDKARKNNFFLGMGKAWLN